MERVWRAGQCGQENGMKNVKKNIDIPEAEIRDQIYKYLLATGCFVWRDYQPTTSVIRGVGNQRKGIADLLGIYNGKPLAVEVKTQKGKLTEDQVLWGKRFKEEGGVYVVARCLDDVREALRYAA